MSFFGGGYGGPTHTGPNPEWPGGDDGTYDSAAKWITFGIGVPILLIALSVLIVYAGGVCFPDRSGLELVWIRGRSVVVSSVLSLHGIATILVARFLFPNMLRQSYMYQYVAIAGIAATAVGLIWFCIAAI